MDFFTNASATIGLGHDTAYEFISVVYLGRYRLGDPIPITVNTQSKPDDVPRATLSPPPYGTSRSFYVPPERGTSTVFATKLRMQSPDPLGRFMAGITWTVGGSPHSITYTFDLVPGGDSAGRVIGLAVSGHPEGDFVLAQTDAGRLVQGDNPSM